MTPEQPSLTEEAPVVPAPRYPIWGWQDVALFFGLGLPLIVMAQLLLAFGAKLFHFPVNAPVFAIMGQAIAYVLMFFLLAGILRMQYNAPFWRSLGWLPSRFSIPGSLALGIAVAFGLALLGGVLHIPDVDSPVKKLLETRDSAVILAVFGILIAPLAEELAFRGFLQPLMVRSLGVLGGIATTALLFGKLHWEQNSKSWAYVGIISLAGAAFGALRYISGSTRTAILAHIAYNSTLFLAYFAYGRNRSFP